jgi:hypothetical protein
MTLYDDINYGIGYTTCSCSISHLKVVYQSRVEGKALITTLEGALEWPLVGVQALDVVLQRIDAGEATIAELTLDPWTIRVVDLKMTL